jgi:hypothetical protein
MGTNPLAESILVHAECYQRYRCKLVSNAWGACGRRLPIHGPRPLHAGAAITPSGSSRHDSPYRSGIIAKLQPIVT